MSRLAMFPITASRPESAAGVVAFEAEVLRYGQNAAAIFDTVAADPDCALAQAYAGLAHIFRSTREGLARATPFVTAAVARLALLRPREARLVGAIARWHAQDPAGAEAILAAHLAETRRDLFAAKLLTLLQFGRGDPQAMRATILSVLPHHRQSAAAHGMLAFAREQCGDHAGAERAARIALDLGRDPWAHHALAHVMDHAGRYAEGRDWMYAHAADWARCSSFLYTHNWWHAALFHIALGEHEAALDLYDGRVWGVRKDYCQDQINAISLLARLELAGVDVGPRWEEIAGYVAPRSADRVDGFLDLHYAYALARAGDDAGVDALLGRACAAGDGIRPANDAIVPAAARGVVAFARGRHAEAHRLLAPVAPAMRLLGGSTVQHELFRRMLHIARGGALAA